MNAAKTPLKVGSFDRFLNFQIGLVIMMQVGVGIVHTRVKLLKCRMALFETAGS